MTEESKEDEDHGSTEMDPAEHEDRISLFFLHDNAGNYDFGQVPRLPRLRDGLEAF